MFKFTGLMCTCRQDPPPAKGAQLALWRCPGARPALSPRLACHDCKQQQQQKPSPMSTGSRASGICPSRDRPKVSKFDGIFLKVSSRRVPRLPGAFQDHASYISPA